MYKIRNKTDLMFDHFVPNITAERNCYRKAIKSTLTYQPYTVYRVRRFQFNNYLFAQNRIKDALLIRVGAFSMPESQSYTLSI